MPDSPSSPTASASSRLSGKTVVGLSESSWSSGCSSASTVLDEHSSHSLIRALFLGDLASAEEHFAYSVPVPGLPAMQGLLEHPDMDLNRTTNSKYGDGIIHFLLRASVGRFVDNKVETIKLCMRHGVNLTQQGAQGDTIFHLLCGPLDYVCSFSEEEYNLSLLRFLFEERRDDAQLRVGVDFRNDYGNTPLMVAVLYGFSGCVQFLLDKGADPEIRGEEGRKPLSWAIQREQMDIVNALLDHGACFDEDIAKETDVMIMKRIIDDFRSTRWNCKQEHPA
ncbi:hypothetical protein K4K57_009187 [Colletotrichum sp. SAR 10_99]|nr:hypothetical protein K4K55_003823 [Colletotrichum sp. SAR 10_96]KAJ5009206.1 hypothetical protein K4K57_009187 [Colletotrichum sp. SAR 10_99]